MKDFIYSSRNSIVREVQESDCGQYLATLFDAIKSVDGSYIRYSFHSSCGVQEIENSHVERVFTYELYRQWYNKIENTGLIINAEIPKQLIDSLISTQTLFFPDMVLHGGQSNSDKHYVICEVKRKEYIDSTPQKAIEDLKKIMVYLGGDTQAKNRNDWKPYKFGVFVMTYKKVDECNSCSTDFITKHFDCVINKCSDEISKRIFLVIYNGCELKFNTLYNLIHSK